MLPDFYKLMYRTHTSQDGIIANGNMTCNLGIITHDAIIANNTIMRQVAIGHDQAVFANSCFPAVFCTTVNGYKFPDRCIVANYHNGIFIFKFRSWGMAAITAPGKMRQFFPILAPSIMVTLLPIQVPSPISTFW